MGTVRSAVSLSIHVVDSSKLLTKKHTINKNNKKNAILVNLILHSFIGKNKFTAGTNQIARSTERTNLQLAQTKLCAALNERKHPKHSSTCLIPLDTWLRTCNRADHTTNGAALALTIYILNKIVHCDGYIGYIYGIITDEFKTVRDTIKFSMALKLTKVLISDSVDASCRQILEQSGIQVDYKTNFTKEELLTAIKVCIGDKSVYPLVTLIMAFQNRKEGFCVCVCVCVVDVVRKDVRCRCVLPEHGAHMLCSP